MNIPIKTFFDAYYADAHADMPPEERVKVLTMKKINSEEKKVRKMPKFAAVAAVLAVIILLSAVTYAAGYRTGLLRTEGLSLKEIETLITEHSIADGSHEFVDENGNTHVIDADGNEVMVLSPAEYFLYERSLMEEQRKKNREDAEDLLDLDSVDAISVMPNSITPLPLDDSGNFGDFLLTNGDMVILHKEGAKGYQLKAGDTVSITVDASRECYVTFGIVRDGLMKEKSSMKDQSFCFEYTIPADGLYCFTLMYFSSDADNFTDGFIQLNEMNG